MGDNQLYVANSCGEITHRNHDCRGYDDSILDYTLSPPRATHLISGWRTVENFDSHHLGIVFDIDFTPSRAASVRKVWNFSQCDWSEYRVSLDEELSLWLRNAESLYESNCVMNLSPCESRTFLESLWGSRSQIVLSVSDKVIGTKQVGSNAKHWWSPHLSELCRARNRARREWKGDRTPEKRRVYNKATRNAHRAILAAKREAWTKFCELVSHDNYSEMWSRFKQNRGKPNTEIPILTVDGNNVVEPHEKVTALNKFFSHVGDPNDRNFDEKLTSHIENWVSECEAFMPVSLSSTLHGSQRHLPENADISESEVIFAMKWLKTRKACGPDLMLKNGGTFLTKSLTFLFKVSWVIGALPGDWKLANVLAIPKCVSPTDCGSFRPIALLSCVGKLMEKVVGALIMYVAERKGWFSERQGGFRQGRSVDEQLLLLKHKVFETFARNQICVVVFLDISKAYDRVWRDALRKKLLSKLGMQGRLLRWVSDFLSKRHGRVVNRGAESDSVEYPFGLPQGGGRPEPNSLKSSNV